MNDQLTNLDVGESIQGDVSDSIKQQLTVCSYRPFKAPRLKLEGMEFLLRDQFGNHYFMLRSMLADGELYDVRIRIKWSRMMSHGGGHADLEDAGQKRKLSITEDCIKDCRDEALVSLGKLNIEVMKARSLGQNPIAIEPKDITAQAEALTDALLAAKKAAGEEVQDEIPPPEFTPVKVDPTPDLPLSAPVPQGEHAQGPESPPRSEIIIQPPGSTWNGRRPRREDGQQAS